MVNICRFAAFIGVILMAGGLSYLSGLVYVFWSMRFVSPPDSNYWVGIAVAVSGLVILVVSIKVNPERRYKDDNER
jgi:drug/metabolite transporter (DMT)-like permease